MKKPDRLHKLLSLHGVASRREAEDMIRQGRVTVNGDKAQIGQSAYFGVDEIAVDGIPLRQHDEFVYIMLNKPRGYITTMKDERGRKTVLQLVSDVGVRIYPVGRLDMDSEGLLLMTNDGGFANAMMHPRFDHLKTYEVLVNGDISSAVELLSRPMYISGADIKAASVKVVESSGREALISVSIHEGRNRQIRKMCAFCGLRIKSLRRISLGELQLGELKSGQWRHLTEDERITLLR